MTISFTVTAIERRQIEKIVQRARHLWPDGIPGTTRLELAMDITACHANGNPLALGRLLHDFPDSDFIHDVLGIRRYLDRSTGQLTDCFVPRSTRTEADVAAATERVLSAIFDQRDEAGS